MKKLCFIFAFIIFLTAFKTDTSALSVSAQFSCVLDAETGRVIYEKNAYNEHSMASTTKIMTALVAIENSDLNDIVTVSKNAAGCEGTSLYLKVGDKISMHDLLYGLLLQSGNDAAIAIAEHVAGSTEKFAILMTTRANNLGAKNTSFKNPNGLDEEGHYTTAYDLALITREALKNETFKTIVSTKSKSLMNNTKTVTNHNKMLNMYDGCIGVKTGFTKKSGRCLVTAAERDGKNIIAVTLNAPDDWSDHKALLDYGFSNTVSFPLLAKGMTVNSVTVKDGSSYFLELCSDSDFYITENPDSKFKNIKISCKIPEFVTAPVHEGEIIGTMDIYYKNELLKTVNLIASASVEFKEINKNDLFFEYLKKLFVSGCTI